MGATARAMPLSQDEKQMKKNNIFLFKRDFDRGQNETLGLPMDQTIVEFVNVTEDDPANRNNYNHFIVHFTPDSGIWAGGTFSLKLKWIYDSGDKAGKPVEWPNEPMITKCLTKIWHPSCHHQLTVRASSSLLVAPVA